LISKWRIDGKPNNPANESAMIEEFGGDLIQWLRGFYFVSQTGSVTRAAEMMRRNEPAISHQIKRLERQFGVLLFDRSRGKMELTTEGDVLLSLVVPLFESLEEIGERLRRPKLPVEGFVRIAASHAIIMYYLPQFLLSFRKSYPYVNFDLYGGVQVEILASLHAGMADFGILSLPEIPARLAAYDLFETRLKLITPKKARSFRTGQFTLETIAQFPYIAFPKTTALTQLIEKRFAKEGLKLNPVFTFNNIAVIKRYVELGMGTTILDEFTITREDERKVAVFDVGRFFDKRKYQIIMRQKKHLNPAAQTLLDIIKKGQST
jgi:DNA-binding transcriptional LysR family regulator